MRYPARYLEIISKEFKGTGLLHLKARLLSSENLDSDLLGRHVKLITPLNSADKVELPIEEEGRLSWPGEPQVCKTYTISGYDPDKKVLSFDLHFYGEGRTSSWISETEAGDQIGMIGPKMERSKELDISGDEYFFAMDLTGLGTLRGFLAKLPADAKGECVVHIKSEDEKIDLNESKLNIHWIVDSSLEKSVLKFLGDGHLSNYSDLTVYMVGHSDSLKALEEPLSKIKNIDQEKMILRPYWK